MKYLFLLGIYTYWAFEGITEAIGTKNNPYFIPKKHQDEYHIYRTFENMGVLLFVISICSALNGWVWLWRLFVGSTAGIGLYEMLFSWRKYGDPLYNKSSKWLFIPHPPGWWWIPIFIVFSTIYWFI